VRVKILVLLLWLKTAPAARSIPAASVKEGQLNGQAAVCKCTVNSSMQRHSAEQVRSSRMTHSLSSRFADVLSLECSRHQLSHPMKADCGLLCNTRSSVATSSGQSPKVNKLATVTASFNPMQTAAADSGLLLNSPSPQQFSFPADESELPVLSCRAPGDFPSNLLLAPVTAPSRQPPRHAAAHHRVC